MKLPLIALAAAALLSASPPVNAQNEGRYLSDVPLEGFSQTGAKGFDDYVGRAVLIEFFAYW